jgi:hypothetical protein
VTINVSSEELAHIIVALRYFSAHRETFEEDLEASYQLYSRLEKALDAERRMASIISRSIDSGQL